MKNFVDFILTEGAGQGNTETRRNNPTTMSRDEEAFTEAKNKHKSTAQALSMAINRAEDARKEPNVTRARMGPLIERVKAAQEKYDDAALALIEFSTEEDPNEDPDVKTYIDKMGNYHERVDNFLTAVAEFTAEKKKGKEDTEYLKISFTKITDFDGSDPSKFKAWYATHKQCVAANPNVPNIQKYLHLHKRHFGLRNKGNIGKK